MQSCTKMPKAAFSPMSLSLTAHEIRRSIVLRRSSGLPLLPRGREGLIRWRPALLGGAGEAGGLGTGVGTEPAPNLTQRRPQAVALVMLVWSCSQLHIGLPSRFTTAYQLDTFSRRCLR